MRIDVHSYLPKRQFAQYIRRDQYGDAESTKRAPSYNKWAMEHGAIANPKTAKEIAHNTKLVQEYDRLYPKNASYRPERGGSQS